MLTETEHSHLFRELVAGRMYHWKVGAAVLASAAAGAFVCNFFMTKEGRSVRRSFFLTVWGTLVIYSLYVWLFSISANGHWYLGLFSFFSLGLILWATFVLEGLETAFLDLHDKDLTQLKAKAIFQRFTKMKATFADAREWWIVALLVTATLMIERDTYNLPGIGVTYDTDWVGRLVRIVLTLILTTFPFVWVAQGPGKYVAARNSNAFISYWFVGPFVSGVRWLSNRLDQVGLQYPSELFDDLAVQSLSKCEPERNLPPSELKFFADGMKRYGFGTLLAKDTLQIKKDGSADFAFKALVYMDAPKSGLTRNMFFLNGLSELQSVRWWLFRTSKDKTQTAHYGIVGEKVEDKLLSVWRSLFESNDPSTWSQPGFYYQYEQTPDFEWSCDPERSDQPDDIVLEESISPRPEMKKYLVTLDFTRSLPKSRNQRDNLDDYLETSEIPASVSNADLPLPEQTDPILILWEIRGKTKPGAFYVPTKLHETVADTYFKKYSTPCLRSTLRIELLETDDIFVNEGRYSVTYDQIRHELETDRFRRQIRTEESNTDKAGYGRKEWTVFVDSPLPGAEYMVGWDCRQRDANNASAKDS